MVGGNNNFNNKVIHIPFNENIKPMWITKKKNIITQEAKYENIVYLHDYIILKEDWYDGFIKFGNDFDVCMTKILNNDNTRFRDWCLWSMDNFNLKGEHIIPYNMTHLTKYMYISGSY